MERNIGLRWHQPSLTGVILSFLFGLSAFIAVLDRLPVSSLIPIPISVYRVLYLPILIGIILLLLRHGQIKWSVHNPTFFLLMGFVFSMILSTFSAFSPYQLIAFTHLMRYLEYSFISIILFLVIRNCWRECYWVHFSWAMLFAALLASITVFTDFWNLTAFYRWYTADRPFVRHMGILGEANYAAAKLCVLLPFILFLTSLYMRRRQWKRLFFVMGVGLVIGITIFVTGSRMGGLLAALILGVFILKEMHWLRQFRVLLVFFMILGILSASFISLPQEPLSRALRYLTNRYGVIAAFIQTGEEQFHEVRETSLRERIDVFRAGLNMFAEHPLLGVGLGNFPFVIGEYDPNYSSVYSHNTYLTVLAELGVVGFLLFILMCLRMLVSIFRMSAFLLPPLPLSPQDPRFYPYLLLSCLSLFFIFFFLHDFDSKYFWTLFLPIALFADSYPRSTN